MSAKNDLEQVLRAYSMKKNTGKISRYNLEKYASHWTEEFRKTKPDFADFTTCSSERFGDLIAELEKEGTIELERDENNSQEISYLRYYAHFVTNIYADVERDPETPFPNEQFYGGAFPASVVEAVDVKTGFIDILESARKESGVVYRLGFPEGIRSMIVVSDLLLTKLLPLCTVRIRSYLSYQKNNEYAYNKLVGLFPRKESNLRDMLANIMTQQRTALNTIRDPDDFTFHFWSNLSTMVVNEFREKENKLDREHSFCQAAYLIGMYGLYFKTKKKDKRERELALKAAEEKLKSPPYLHSFNDIYAFKDRNGLPISRKVSREDLAKYLERKTKNEQEDPLPNILRLRTVDKKEYFIAKERALTMVLQRCHSAGKDLKQQYVQEWAEILGDFKKSSHMSNRKLFQEDMWKRLEETDPVLSSALRFELIFILLKETKPMKEVYYEANRILDEKQGKLIPIDEILRLDPKRLITEARTYLPLWKSIPLVGLLGVYLGRVFSSVKRKSRSRAEGGDASPRPKPAALQKESKPKKAQGPPPSEPMGGAMVMEPPPAGRRSQGKEEIQRQREYKKAVAKLTESYLEEGKSIDLTLDELVEAWNPIMEGKAKNDLVEDVNSAVRDFLRKIRRKIMSPPDKARIHNLAAKVAEYQAFERIKNKRDFQTYIELYMLKLLGK